MKYWEIQILLNLTYFTQRPFFHYSNDTCQFRVYRQFGVSVKRRSYMRKSDREICDPIQIYCEFHARETPVLCSRLVRFSLRERKRREKSAFFFHFQYSPAPTPPPGSCPTRAASPRPDSRDADPKESSPRSGCSSPCRRRRRGRRRAPPPPAASCRSRWNSLPP